MLILILCLSLPFSLVLLHPNFFSRIFLFPVTHHQLRTQPILNSRWSKWSKEGFCRTSIIQRTIPPIGWFHVIELHRSYTGHALINAVWSNKLIRGCQFFSFPPPRIGRVSLFSTPSRLLPSFLTCFPFPLLSPLYSLSHSSSVLPASTTWTRGFQREPVTRATLGISHN